MKHIGFTGTRHGMTIAQRRAVTETIIALDSPVLVAHHGDCVGADDEFHDICKVEIGMYVHSHPSTHSLRAFCKADAEHERKLPMARNRDIVNSADVMIAAPYEMQEQERGDTWSTIRMARHAMKPLCLVLRDGTVLKERMP